MRFLLQSLWHILRGLLSLLSDLAWALEPLSRATGLAALLFVLVHLGADQIDNATFVALNFWDLRFENFCAFATKLLLQHDFINTTQAVQWSRWAIDLVDIHRKEIVAAMLALCVELFADFAVLLLWHKLKKKQSEHKRQSAHDPDRISPQILTNPSPKPIRPGTWAHLRALSIMLFAVLILMLLYRLSPLFILSNMAVSLFQDSPYQGPSPLIAYQLPLRERLVGQQGLFVQDDTHKPREQRLLAAVWPVPVMTRISSPFGWRMHPILNKRVFHNGVDLAVPVGTPVHSMLSGLVTRVAEDSRSGKYIRINHGQGLVSVYCHLDASRVQQGQRLRSGEIIAASGNSGRSTGAHLHLGLRIDGKATDPVVYRRQIIPQS